MMSYFDLWYLYVSFSHPLTPAYSFPSLLSLLPCLCPLSVSLSLALSEEDEESDDDDEDSEEAEMPDKVIPMI
jgi:hypothetical protein